MRLRECRGCTYNIVLRDIRHRGDMRAPGAATGVTIFWNGDRRDSPSSEDRSVDLSIAIYSDATQATIGRLRSKALKEACCGRAPKLSDGLSVSAEPRSMTDGNELVGWGVASGVWEALQMPFSTKIVMTANGHVEMSSAASDIGTGTYTIMTQVAADMLGVPVGSVTVKLADFDASHSAGRRRIVDRGVRRACDRQRLG